MSTGNTELYQECTHMKFSGLIIHTLVYPENWAKVMGVSLSKIANFPMSHSHWLYPECSQIYHENVPLSQRESRKGNYRSSYAYPNNNGSMRFSQKKWCNGWSFGNNTNLDLKAGLSIHQSPVTWHWATYWISEP